MARSGESRAQANKRLRQEKLREQLANQKLVEQVAKDSRKIADLGDDLDAHSVNRLKIANELRLKLINKYLPDLKSTEVTGDPENPVAVTAGVQFQGVSAQKPKGKK